jgi:hypothetical protein
MESHSKRDKVMAVRNKQTTRTTRRFFCHGIVVKRWDVSCWSNWWYVRRTSYYDTYVTDSYRDLRSRYRNRYFLSGHGLPKIRWHHQRTLIY